VRQQTLVAKKSDDGVVADGGQFLSNVGRLAAGA
jgi:hypothetical protein